MSDHEARKILFIVAHPYLEKSRANRAITEAVAGIPSVTVEKLYHRYPYFHIDVDREQRQLSLHDLIVVQHPFYWYSMPALLKLWLDEVLESGWAYGPEGTALAGKDFQLSITTGGAREAYGPQGHHGHSLETLLLPWRQTAKLCGMRWHEPLVLHRSIRAEESEVTDHALNVRRTLENYARGESRK